MLGIPDNFKARVILLLATVLLTPGCEDPTSDPLETRSDTGTNDGPISIYPNNYPLAYFAERIGGNRVMVSFPVPADEDPAYWAPDAETIGKFQQADLILLNGASYAAWVQRATLPAARSIDTSANFADQYLPIDDAVVHSHGPDGEHVHQDTAFTVWLDPELAIKQSEAIRDALTTLRPDLKNEFDSGFEALAADLKVLDREFRTTFESIGEAPLLFSHPVYQYLIRRYQLNAVSVHWEPDQLPGETDFTALTEIGKNHPARIMIWEDEPLTATRELLAGLDISSVVFDPVANRPDEGDFLTEMHGNVGNLKDAL